ncbi:hypothetical protein ACH4E7_29670 [Kitasatospora sp. NPDC018058]|uniref:hypothetical protein n=1 Tax=Kitasatospora sp. NPDC018058 TaxID=3364025 RepID=UPI0037BE7D6C
MRHSLTDLARYLWGDEYGPTPGCDAQWQHEESYFTELLTFAGRTRSSPCCGPSARTWSTATSRSGSATSPTACSSSSAPTTRP